MKEKFKDPDESIRTGIEKAREQAKTKTFKVGDLACHEGDGDFLVYRIEEINGDVVTLQIPAENSRTKQEIILKCPLGEIFDPKTAYGVAMSEHFKDKLPKN